MVYNSQLPLIQSVQHLNDKLFHYFSFLPRSPSEIPCPL